MEDAVLDNSNCIRSLLMCPTYRLASSFYCIYPWGYFVSKVFGIAGRPNQLLYPILKVRSAVLYRRKGIAQEIKTI